MLMTYVKPGSGLLLLSLYLAVKNHRHAGTGLRVIGDFMECRDALGMRLLFQRNGDTLEFHFYGSHDQVKAFLRNRR